VAHAGQIIADLYRLEEPLGRGAMGRIWRAKHLRLESRVAIKFLEPEICDDPESFNRFLREARAAAAVRSAHVVQIFDCGIDAGTPYISMELLEGESLDKRLFARTVLSDAELVKVFSEIARAVDTAHEFGVIHRDLKPGNIFIVRERDFEFTKVLDFGIAKLMNPGSDVDSAAGTRTGTMLGTPYYMSPEQVRGSRSLDRRTDLWSLAVIAFECLTGQLPFQGESVGSIVVQICTTTPRRPSELADVPPGFDEWFSKGTSKEPSDRFATAREMAEALSELLANAPAPAALPRVSRAGTAREPATLQSGPAPSGVAGGGRGSAPLPTRKLEADPGDAAMSVTRGHAGTIEPVGPASQVPPSASTRALTAAIAPAKASSARAGLSPARGRRAWVAVSVSLLCFSGAAALWQLGSERTPSAVAGAAFSAASPSGSAASSPSGDGAPNEVRAPAARADAPGRHDAGVERVLVSDKLPAPGDPPPDAPSPKEPWAGAAGVDPDMLEPAPLARVAGAKAGAPSKARSERRGTRSSRESTSKKPRRSARSVRPSPAPEPAPAEPTHTPRERQELEPFSDRR
jgi:serine/threonine protein kinase